MKSPTVVTALVDTPEGVHRFTKVIEGPFAVGDFLSKEIQKSISICSGTVTRECRGDRFHGACSTDSAAESSPNHGRQHPLNL